jgi:NADH dehydrogenase
VSGIDAQGLVIGAEIREPADLVIWAAPSRPVEAVRKAFNLPPGARVPVDGYLRARGADGTYAAGDAAAVIDLRSGLPAPANAQVAIYCGTLAADNLVAAESGGRLRELRVRPTSEVISLGGHRAVSEVFGVSLRGRAALAVKEAALARYLYRYGGSRLAAAYAAVP